MRLFLAALQRKGRDIDLTRSEGMSPIAVSRADLEHDLDICLADMTPDEISNLRPLAYRHRAALAQQPLFVKVHDQYGQTASGEPLFPPEITLGCLHIVRDPRDVCLSLAAHNRRSIDHAIKVLGRPSRSALGDTKSQVEEERGTWSTHTLSWQSAPLRRLTLRYEDLLADPTSCFTDVARFCGLDALPEDIATAVELTDFARLAAKEAESGFAERPDGMERFFRAGTTGQWRTVLTPEQIRQIETDHALVMGRLGYEFVSNA